MTIPIAARQADVWHCFSPFEELPGKIRVFEEHAAAAGRDPSSIARATDLPIDRPWERLIERANALKDLGFGYLVVPWPEGGRQVVEAFASNVIPSVA